MTFLRQGVMKGDVSYVTPGKSANRILLDFVSSQDAE